jgi:hypothetical protein
VNLTHPNTDHAIEVDPDHAGPYLSQGWQESAPPKKTSTARASDGESGTAPHTNTTKEEA